MADAMNTPEAVVDERAVLRQSIERDEAELRDAVEDLKVAVQSEFSLRHQISDHPVPWLVGGFLLGAWLGRRRHD